MATKLMTTSPDSRTILAELLANPRNTQKYFRDVQRLIGSVLLDNAMRIDRIENKMNGTIKERTKWGPWFVDKVLPLLVVSFITAAAIFTLQVWVHVDVLGVAK